MFRTITVAGQIMAQGELVTLHADGRATISVGAQLLTGWPVAQFVRSTALALFGFSQLAQAIGLASV